MTQNQRNLRLRKYTESVVIFPIGSLVISRRLPKMLPNGRPSQIARCGNQTRRTKRCTRAANPATSLWTSPRPPPGDLGEEMGRRTFSSVDQIRWDKSTERTCSAMTCDCHYLRGTSVRTTSVARSAADNVRLLAR